MATIRGTDNDDFLEALLDNDVLKGLDGDDILLGGNKLIGGDGDDILLGKGGKDKLKGGDGDDLLLGGKGKDKLKGGDGDDLLSGGKGKDKLMGESGDDILRGGAGNDELIGGIGYDSLVGGSGNDILNGTSSSGAGLGEIDVLTGGSGVNTFVLGITGVGDATKVFYRNDANPGVVGDFAIITDFTVGVDKLQVTDFAGGGVSGFTQGDYFTQPQVVTANVQEVFFDSGTGFDLIAQVDTGGVALTDADLTLV